jgi:hypothetical protein
MDINPIVPISSLSDYGSCVVEIISEFYLPETMAVSTLVALKA